MSTFIWSMIGLALFFTILGAIFGGKGGGGGIDFDFDDDD